MYLDKNVKSIKNYRTHVFYKGEKVIRMGETGDEVA